MTQLTQQFEAALVYATRLHANQRRKVGDVPYVAHLLAVTALVLEDGGSEDEAIAALLHDAVEDQGGLPTREAIRQQFGETVVAIVDGCTESHSQPKSPWLERKTQYLEQIRSGSPSVRRVSLADKLHNVRSLVTAWQVQGDDIWQHFNQGKTGTLAFYQQLLQIYRQTATGPMVGELTRLMAELAQPEYDEEETHPFLANLSALDFPGGFAKTPEP